MLNPRCPGHDDQRKTKRYRYVDYPQTPQVFPDFGPGRCHYCGKELIGRQRKWCCGRHGVKYWQATQKYVRIWWKEFRMHILIRDKFVCQWGGRCCHGPFEVHHIVPISEGGMEFDENNCITLCKRHHLKQHGKSPKGI